MVLLPIYDIGLPPLGALVLFSLHYWILTRIRRKKLLKMTKLSNLELSSYNKEVTVNDIAIAPNSDNSSSDIWRLSEKDTSSICSSLINGKEELADKKITSEECVEFARNNTNLAGNQGVVTRNEKMLHQVDCALLSFGEECPNDLLYKGLSAVHESRTRFENKLSPSVADLNFASLESDFTNIPQSQTKTICNNGEAEVLRLVNKSDSVLLEKQSNMKLFEEFEMSVGHEAEVVDRGFSKKDSENDRDASIEVVTDFESSQKSPSEMAFNLAKDSSTIPELKDYKSFEEGDLFDGDAVRDESDVYVKDAEESEDTKSQLSGGTNETSEDSGIDNVVERDQKTSSREQPSSKSESEDCDSYISSTLVSTSDNDITQLEEVLGDRTEDESEKAGIQLPTCTEGVETIIENQFMESYTSFLFPQNLSGLLIGRSGSFVKSLNRETGASLSVLPYKDHLVNVVLVALSCDEVLNGLTSLREKFANYVDVDFDTVLEESFDVTARKKLIGEDYWTKYTHVSVKYAFPADLVGMLIGRNGSLINEVSITAGVEIDVDNAGNGYHIITIIGLPDKIETARQMIKANFPSAEFPQVDLEESLPQTPFKRVKIDRSMWMVPSESLEVVKVSSIVSPNHFFVQRIMMPSYGRLKSFCLSLNKSYNIYHKDPLPQPVRVNTLCVVELNGSFYRGVTIDCRRHDCAILFVDFGGQKVYKNSDIYMIRPEFMHYTFQAVECFLDGVQPLAGVKFSAESMKYMQTQMGNKELLMKALYIDDVGRTHVDIYVRNERGEEVNLAEKAATENVISYIPSYQP